MAVVDAGGTSGRDRGRHRRAGLACDHGESASRAKNGGGGRRDGRVPVGQRDPRPAGSRQVQADSHRQPDRVRGVPARRLRRSRNGSPAGTHALQRHHETPQRPQGTPGPRSPVQWDHLGRSHQLLRNASGRSREPGIRTGTRSRPHDEQPDPGRGPGVRDVGGEERVRARRKQPEPGALATHDGRRIRMAQLRPLDHRQPSRHRTRARLEPQELLPQVLPARQRDGDRRRTVRSPLSTRPDPKHLRPDSSAQTKTGQHLHRRTCPGWRTNRHAQTSRQSGRRRSHLSHPRRTTPRFRSTQTPHRYPHQLTHRTTLQVAGSDQASRQSRRQRLRLSRSRRDRTDGRSDSRQRPA